MKAPPIPENEEQRLEAVHKLDLLDTDPEERFDRICELTTTLLQTPIAYLSLIAGEKQFYKATCGMGDMRETPRSLSFCAHTVYLDETLIVEDATGDERFFDNPYVSGEPGVRFYMGQPLHTLDGHCVGTFCVLDVQPRQVSEAQKAHFLSLAAIAETELNLRDALTMKRELEQRNRFIRNVLGRYVTREVADVILDSPDALKLGGEARTITILMSDLRNFTGMSERMAPGLVVAVLNRYLARMVDIILHYGGTVDEIIGDAILVFFGAPLPMENAPEKAIACALAMQKAMEEFNEESRRLGQPELYMGIAINTGEVVVGNIGSHRRMKYSAVGSPVNQTARIESFTVPGQVLISGSTLSEVRDIARVDGRLRVKMKGYDGPVTIYDVGGLGGEHQLYLENPCEFEKRGQAALSGF